MSTRSDERTGTTAAATVPLPETEAPEGRVQAEATLAPPITLREALGELAENVLVPADLHPFLPPDAVRFDCGGCQASWVGRGIRPNSAAAFCPACDYPLFFGNRPAVAPRTETRSAQRRLPGVDGRDALGRIVCRGCGEPNPPDEQALCLRCGAYLTPPKPETVTVEVVREVPVEVVRHDHRWRWTAIAALGALGASVVVNVVLALHP